MNRLLAAVLMFSTATLQAADPGVQRQMKCAAQNPGNRSVETNAVQIGVTPSSEESMESRIEPRMDANERE